MNDLSEFYNINLLTYKIRGVVFYGDNVSIDLNDFRNVTFIVLDDEGYAKYISYKNNTSTLELVENNLQKHTLIMMNYFSYLGAKFNDNNKSMLIVINDKDFGLSIGTQISNNLVKSKIDKTILDEYEVIPVSYQSTMKSYCDISECYSGVSGDCAWDNASRDVICYEFSNGTCHDDESDEYYNDKVIRPNGYKAAMYSIRDSFLINTLKGKQYIDFYYKLSHVFKVSNLYSSEEKSLIEITNFIRNKSIAFILGNSNDIIISNNDYNELKAYIVKFRTVNANKEYQYILDVLDNDLDFLKNKKKNEIYNYFND